MAKAGGYFLRLDLGRADLFAERIDMGELFSEPVSDFSHSRSAPLVCFVVTADSLVTHIARGGKGVVAGSEMRRLNVIDPRELREPIQIVEILSRLSGRSASSAKNTIIHGGLFTPKAFEHFVEVVSEVSPEAKAILKRFSRSRKRLIESLSDHVKSSLGDQKEAVTAALAIAGIDRRSLHDWAPPESGAPLSFLSGLPQIVAREDALLTNDLVNVPGFSYIGTVSFSAARFEADGRRLTVILANRLPLEELTGCDLIYYNETMGSFVMVQYKAMESGVGSAIFRLPNADLDKEIGRMRTIEKSILKIGRGSQKDDFRLHSSPFYIKLCTRRVFNPDDVKISPGMYFPLDHWESVAKDPASAGAKGGWGITSENAGRYMDNEIFVSLVAQGWIGSHAKASEFLEAAIRNTLETGKAAVIAIDKDGLGTSRRARTFR